MLAIELDYLRTALKFASSATRWIRSEHITSESNESYRTENKSPFSQRWFDGRAIKPRNGKATLIEMKGPEVDRFLLWAMASQSASCPVGKLRPGKALSKLSLRTRPCMESSTSGRRFAGTPNGTHSRVAVAAMSDPDDKGISKSCSPRMAKKPLTDRRPA